MQKLPLTCCLLATLLTCGLLRPGGANAQASELEASVLSNAGGTAEAGGFSLVSTIGQSSPVGRAAGETYVLFSGYPSPFFGAVAVLITYTPPVETQSSGEPVTVTARIEPREAPISNAALRYRSGGDASFETVNMTRTPEGPFQANIPATAIGATGIAYQIVATDAKGNSARVPAAGVFSFPVHIGGRGLITSRSLPAGATASAYRLISVPLRPDQAEPSAVLGDEVPALQSDADYDEVQARFFLPRGETVSEFPRTPPMTPGRAFWLIVRDGLDGFDTGPGEVLALNNPTAIELEAGWNFVANPFNFAVPVENLRLESAGNIVLRSYTGSYNDVTDPVTAMQPFTGYAMFAEQDNILFVDPKPATSGASKGAAPEPRAARAGQSANEERLTWSLRIIARSRRARDADNVAGVAPGATADKGPLDWPEPPAAFSSLSVHFPHQEWNESIKRYSSDVRGSLSKGAVWTFVVTAGEDATLTVEGVAGVPARFEVWLVDPKRKFTKNLRKVSRYTIPPTGALGQPFRLIVGTEAFVQARLEALDLLPDMYTLDQPFPNPSRGMVRLRFGLPAATRVTAEVFDILGRRVVTVLDGKRLDAGYHRLRWNGRVASGMYFIRIRTDEFAATRKVVIVR